MKLTKDNSKAIESIIYDDRRNVVFIFSAEWCKASESFVEDFYKYVGSEIDSLAYTVDIDEFKDVADKYNVSSKALPCILLFKGGEMVDRFEKTFDIMELIMRSHDLY